MTTGRHRPARSGAAPASELDPELAPDLGPGTMQWPVAAGTQLAEVSPELQHPVVRRLGRDPNLSQGAARGAGWTAGARLGTQIVMFVGTIATARLLLPTDYGQAAVAVSISAFAAIFSDLGIGSAVIHARRVTERLLSSVFWLNAVSGLVLAAVVCGVSFPLSRLYGDHELVPLMCLSSLNFAFDLDIVQTALLERALRFRDLAAIESGAGICGVGVLVGTAALGAGPFAIVLGTLTPTALINVALWLWVRWVPRERPRGEEIARVWRFSRGITGFNALNFWSRNLDNVLLGKFASTASLGFYVRAFALMRLPIGQMNAVLGRVLFPTLARLRDDRDRMGRAWLQAISTGTALTLPVTVGLAATAPAFIEVVYGHRWLPMTLVLELLAAAAAPQLVGATTGGLLRAAGRTSLLFKVGLWSSGLSILAIVAGLPWGATGVATALLIKSWLGLPIVLVPCLRVCGLTLRGLLSAIRGPLAASTAMATVAVLVRIWLGTRHPAWEVLCAQLLAGGVAYLAVLWRVDPGPLRQLRRRLGARRRAAG